MKQIGISFLLLFTSLASHAQFVQLIAEEVDNQGLVPGRTYRIYAEMTNEGDQIYIIYGDSLHPLTITSTSPFYQCPLGGATSREVNRKLANENDSLLYDSWVTIGAADNYNNEVASLNVDFKAFEQNGAPLVCKTDGCWFCLPTHKQAYCGPDKRILLMQLTTKGKISGTINVMGKTAKGEMYKANDISITIK